MKPHPEEIKKMAAGVFSPDIGNVWPHLNWEAEQGQAWLVWRGTVDGV